ncbi:Hypothetical predicted protein [Pelobates cultripes]|uniref:Uncharacterized protein n=1 Tax=Pelobates cultripes TaxID=61616 RepID=A0AAD1RDG1_PELCU|nr:Hypothetical predicted protein [Pelobates cultripes]
MSFFQPAKTPKRRRRPGAYTTQTPTDLETFLGSAFAATENNSLDQTNPEPSVHMPAMGRHFQKTSTPAEHQHIGALLQRQVRSKMAPAENLHTVASDTSSECQQQRKQSSTLPDPTDGR